MKEKIDINKATAREKAIAYCMGYLDPININEEPIYTKEEALQIKSSIVYIDEIRQFNKLVTCYKVYAEFVKTWGLAYAEFKASANVLVALARRWDFLESVIEFHNSIILNWGASDEKTKDVKQLLSCFPVDDAKFIDLPDGRISLYLGKNPDEEESNIYNQALRDSEMCEFSLMVVKSVTEAVEKWTRAKGCKAVMPPIYKKGIEIIKGDYARYVGKNGLKFSKKHLQERKANGEKITDYDRVRAIFPVYEELKIDKEIYNTYYQRLKDIENEKAWG